jgi:glycoside/pentoside/hexuronide:cation symporter, GPH family
MDCLGKSEMTHPPFLRYGILAVPLAFAGLPIYLHIPHLYATLYSVPLATLGLVLMLVRLMDAFVDPLIGLLSDRSRFTRRQIIMMAALPLMLGFVGLFNPPTAVQNITLLPWWLGTMMAVTYLAFSVMMINYYAAGMVYGEAAQTRVSAFREGGMLIGVMLASILPSILIEQGDFSESAGYRIFSILFIPLTVTCMLIAFTTLPSACASPDAQPRLRDSVQMLRAVPIRRLLLLFLCNALPTAITSTLFLFYVSNVLQTASHAGGLLLTYFLAAALSIPLWTWLAGCISHRNALAAGMVLAIASFVWAYGLGAGDVQAFYVICALSGIAMGADVTLLPVLFAYALRSYPTQTAFAYSLWHVVSKLTLALAAGVVLPLLAWWGYNPTELSATQPLSVAYALIPCALKMLALIALLRFSSSHS